MIYLPVELARILDLSFENCQEAPEAATVVVRFDSEAEVLEEPLRKRAAGR